MKKTHLVGISQVVEQFVRVILIIGITFYVVSTNRSLYELGTLAALATIIGTFVAVIYLGIKFLLRKTQWRRQLVRFRSGKQLSGSLLACSFTV